MDRVGHGRTCAPVILALVLGLLHSSLAGEAGASQEGPGAVERRLVDYLEGRVLVFRDRRLVGDVLEFDREGRSTGEQGARDVLRAMRFLELDLGGNRLTLRGEEVWPEIRDGERVYVRRSDAIHLVTVQAPVPDSPGFPDLIRVLARIFLTAGELESGPGHAGRRLDAPPNRPGMAIEP